MTLIGKRIDDGTTPLEILKAEENFLFGSSIFSLTNAERIYNGGVLDTPCIQAKPLNSRAFVGIESHFVGVFPETLYRVSADVEVEATQNVVITVVVDGTTYTSNVATNTSGYTNIEVSFTMPIGVAEFDVSIGTYDPYVSNPDNEKIRIDDVKLFGEDEILSSVELTKFSNMCSSINVDTTDILTSDNVVNPNFICVLSKYYELEQSVFNQGANTVDCSVLI
jgi:hypothetical protein